MGAVTLTPAPRVPFYRGMEPSLAKLSRMRLGYPHCVAPSRLASEARLEDTKPAGMEGRK